MSETKKIIAVIKKANEGEPNIIAPTPPESEADIVKSKLISHLRKKTIKEKAILNLNEENYKIASWGLKYILEASEPNGREWNMQNNKLENRLLLAWFCKDKKIFDETAKEMNREDLMLNKNLYVQGEKGSGKSSTVFALNELVSQLPKKPGSETRSFKFVEQNKMNNTFEVEGNINKYTFNEEKGKFEGKPYNIVLDDLKLDASKLTKSFGTDFIHIVKRFLYDRYSLWLFGQANTIITSLLTPSELKKALEPDLYQRFQHQYNCITFTKSERKA